MQTEFFDTTSRGASFDYDAFLADIAKRPLSSTRRLTPRQEETVNPLYGQGKLFFCMQRLSLDRASYYLKIAPLGIVIVPSDGFSYMLKEDLTKIFRGITPLYWLSALQTILCYI